MGSRCLSALVLATTASLCVSLPVAAVPPWHADGAYFEQFDAPAGKFKTKIMRWIWSPRLTPGTAENYVAYFDCWRVDQNDGVGTNKIITQWTLTGLDSDELVALPKWSAKLKNGFLDAQTRLINQTFRLAADSMILVEAKLTIKGAIGAQEYVGCDMDLSEFAGPFDGTFERRE